MKLLLTSAGVANKSIETALREMLAKEFSDTNLLFVTTAQNVEAGDKSWVIKDLVKCKELGFKEIEMTDVAAVGRDIWLPKLEHANVILVEGGNTSYLMKHIRTSGLIDELPRLLKTRVYVGISAGSIVMAPKLKEKEMQPLYKDAIVESENEGLGYVDFMMAPHMNSESFPKVTELVESVAEKIGMPLYALDDQSAIKVVDGKVEVISEGTWKKFN